MLIKINDSKTRFHKALVDLGIYPNAISNNYAEAIWQVKTELTKCLRI